MTEEPKREPFGRDAYPSVLLRAIPWAFRVGVRVIKGDDEFPWFGIYEVHEWLEEITFGDTIWDVIWELYEGRHDYDG